jgi:hypothetical protein
MMLFSRLFEVAGLWGVTESEMIAISRSAAQRELHNMRRFPLARWSDWIALTAALTIKADTTWRQGIPSQNRER